MILNSNLWEKIKWLWRTFWSLKRTPYPKTKWGTGLILTSISVPLINIGTVVLDITHYLPIPISYIYKEIPLVSYALSLLGIFTGIALIYSEWNITSRNVAKVLISSIPNMNLEFPESLLDPAEKYFFRDPITLGVQSSSNEDIHKQIEIYNAELTANIFPRFIIHNQCNKLYIGGLARVPFLVSYGSLLRNTSVNINYFDKSHNGQREWFLLDQEKVELNYIARSEDIQPNSNGDIAIAVSFTSEITDDQIPLNLIGHTLFIEPNSRSERNLIKNDENLQEAAQYIISKVDFLSRKENLKKIHLFLSIQSPLALAIGQRYQEGMHRNLVIHNFDAQVGKYVWGLELSSKGIEYFDSILLY